MASPRGPGGACVRLGGPDLLEEEQHPAQVALDAGAVQGSLTPLVATVPLQQGNGEGGNSGDPHPERWGVKA